MSLSDDLSTVGAKPKLGALADLLDRSGIDVADISSVQRVNVWQGFMKDEDGDPQVVDLHGITLVPKWADGPEWPVVAQGPSVRMPAVSKPRTVEGWETAVVLPDMQIGYFRLHDDNLEPIHDEAAIAAALAVVKAARPSQVVCVGDNLDLAELGRYRTTPAWQRTTQASVDRATLLCAQLRAAAPDAEIVWLAGNHEERLPNYILDNAKAAFGLRKGNAPESWPVLSVPYLCRMDEFGVVYRPGYPASNHWITPRLQVIHGDKHTSNGSTAHKYLATRKTSVIYGHVHRREYAATVREDHDGPREIMAASPGCLARIDGAVPSTKGGIDLDGRPLVRYEDWNQGLAVVEYESETGRFDYQNLAVIDGVARWRGKEYSG